MAPYFIKEGNLRGEYKASLLARQKSHSFTLFCDLIVEGTSYHSCCVLLIRSQALGSAHAQEEGVTAHAQEGGLQRMLRRRGLHAVMNTERQGSRNPPLKSVYHTPVQAGSDINSSRTMWMETGESNPPKEYWGACTRRRENGSKMDKQQRPLTKQLREFVANTITYLACF